MKTNGNWLEGVVFLVSCVLVVLVMGYVAVDAWTMGDAPPDLTVTLGTPERGAGGWRVPVTVRNQGDSAAEQVRVAVEVREGDQVRERAEFVIDYVPRQSHREGWASFRQVPASATLDAAAVGYMKP